MIDGRYSGKGEFRVVEGDAGADLVIGKKAKGAGEDTFQQRFPRAWFTPRLDGGVVIGDGRGLLSGLAPSNAGFRFGYGRRIALFETWQGVWVTGAANPTNPSFVYAADIAYGTPVLKNSGLGFCRNAKRSITAGVITDTEGESYCILAYADTVRGLAIGEKIKLTKVSGPSSVTEIYDLGLYPYYTELAPAQWANYDPEGGSNYSTYEVSEIVGFYYNTAEWQEDADLEINH